MDRDQVSPNATASSLFLEPSYVTAGTTSIIPLGQVGPQAEANRPSTSHGELVDQLARFLVAVLDGRTLMKYADGPSNGPPMPRSWATLQQRRASMTTPGRVGRVPHLQLELDVEGHVAEVAALDADVRPLAPSSHGTWSLGPTWTSSSEMPWSICP